MTRLPDWFERMEAVLDHYQAGAFVRGRMDCVTLGLDVVEAVTGQILFPELRGYASREEAAARGMALGFASMGDGLASVLPEMHPVRAGRADLGIAQSPEGDACVVFVEAELLGFGPAGLWRLPRGNAKRAFKVG